MIPYINPIDVIIMKLEGKYLAGSFKHRPNRFLSIVEIMPNKGTIQVVEAHVPDPGRLKELLIPNAEVILRESEKKNRKTKYSLVGVKTGNLWVNIDSQISNELFKQEYATIPILRKYSLIKPEFKWGKSRFDFLLRKGSQDALVEIKSVTLVKNGLALFPDAPTTRGVRHLKELTSSLDEGMEAFIVFIIKREDATSFTSNNETDPLFSKTLKEATEAGVKAIVVKCSYDPILKRELRFQSEISFIEK